MEVTWEMTIEFNKIGETKWVKDLQVSLLDSTELFVKSNSLSKLVNMSVNLIGLNLNIKEENGNVVVTCNM